ncbi:hypothetical protein RHGRI_037754 [Rhododendron griersonianum]|uniref:Isopenicillin N synthase-like Fe(2+) 2OG dioxygenase domain-containing protein n=1 Tax=Rhododendron griersonianum TaxID=479676 RepID=A0AAV6HSY1_9ERIC|nr:hypothetical protein RHGRI_037754 [Rhododendron griersonianum]
MESPPEVVNFGKSIIVPSVQQLAKQPLDKLPPRYVHDFVSSGLRTSDDSSLLSVPVIDLQSLVSGDRMDYELERLHSSFNARSASSNFRTSTVLVPSAMVDTEKTDQEPYCSDTNVIAREEETEMQRRKIQKKKLWQQPDNHEGFGQLFVVSEDQKLDWSDMFYITTLPSSLRRTQLFELLPPNLGETLESYSVEVRRLAMTILGQMAKALKMDSEEMRELFSDGVQSMRMNYYPPCPEPDMAIGFSPHSDADALTILYQLNGINGLQI